MENVDEPSSLTTPKTSPPVLIPSAEIQQNKKLANSIRDLCNQAFSRHKALDPVKWNPTNLRFPNMQVFYEMLTPEAVFAVVFEDDEAETKRSNDTCDGITDEETANDGKTVEGAFGTKKVIACAAAIPWSGGWSKEGAGKETGWEIKTVCVEGELRYLRKGLAVQTLAALESHLVDVERSKLQAKGVEVKAGHVDLLLLAAECLNGMYWRKRGYEKVRSKWEGPGVWSCRTSFELAVFKKRVEFG